MQNDKIEPLAIKIPQPKFIQKKAVPWGGYRKVTSLKRSVFSLLWKIASDAAVLTATFISY